MVGTIALRGLSDGIDEGLRDFRHERLRFGSDENAVRPQRAAERRQRIGERGSPLGRVPGSRSPGRTGTVAGQVPEPDRRVGPEREGGRPLRALRLPALGSLAAQQLLGVAEGDLDRPAPVVERGHQLGRDGQVGAEEEVVVLALIRVGDDHEHDLLEGSDGVPQKLSRQQGPLDLLATQVDVGDSPVVGGQGELGRGAEAGTLLARPAALTGPAGRSRIVEGGVALDAGDDVGAGQVAASQAGVGAVAAEDERVVGQPAGHLLDHLLAQVEQGAAVALAVATHVDGQADGLAAPGRPDAQGEHDQVQPVGEDGALATGADGVAEAAGAVHLAAGLVEEGVVNVHDQAQVALEVADEQGRQPAPELSHLPLPLAQEAMVGVVGVDAVWIGHVHHAGDGAPAGAERPAGDQREEETGGRSGEEVGEASDQALPRDDGRVVGAVRRADGGRRGYRGQERASVDWSLDNRPNGGASPSASAPLATSATAGSPPADHAPPFYQAPAAARQRPAAGLDWLYRSATTSGASRRPETAKVHTKVVEEIGRDNKLAGSDLAQRLIHLAARWASQATNSERPSARRLDSTPSAHSLGSRSGNGTRQATQPEPHELPAARFPSYPARHVGGRPATLPPSSRSNITMACNSNSAWIHR